MVVASLPAFSVPAEAGAPLDRVQSAVAAVIKIVTRPDLLGPTHLVARRALLRENVSLAANYRTQINRVLRTTSFATRLARMRAGQLTAMAIPRGAGEAAVGASATPVVGLVQTYRVAVGMMAKL